MSRGHVGKTCPFCQAPMMPGVRASVCSVCGIPHHAECWAENGGCTTDGCTGNQARLEVKVIQEPAVILGLPTAPARRRYSFKSIAIVGLLAVVLFGGMFASRVFRHSGKISINPKDGAEMVWVPAGEFQMGSNNGDENEKPQHTVYLDGYWMYKYEVTVAQYRKFCEATGRGMPNTPSWGWQDSHPIVNVSWRDARAYATWAGARLPTEAEWEKAARGTDGRTYPWGNKWDKNKCLNGDLHLVSVGSYPAGASPYGCMDMAGNAWEWCADWYDSKYYTTSPSRNPKGQSRGSYRVLRGGSWDSRYDVYGYRCAYRNGGYPDSGIIIVGFRLVR